MSRQTFRAQADGYGVHLELAVEHRPGTTPEELARALDLLAAQARARLAAHDPRDICPSCTDCQSCAGGTSAFPTQSRVVVTGDLPRLVCTACHGSGTKCPNLDTWEALSA